MLHLQDGVANMWEALDRAPAGVLVLAVDRPDLLREAKQRKPSCVTMLRHWYDDGQHYDNASYATKLNRAAVYFNSFMDGTFYGQYSGYVDIVGGWNEVWAESQTSQEKADRVEQERAMIEVFNRDHKPRLPSHVKYAFSSSAVGNSQPREMYQLSVSTGMPIQDHPYTHWVNGVRSSGDWQNLSGLWNRKEQEYGIKATYVFSEGGPFESAVDGWRSPACLSANISAYVNAVRSWIRDVQQTSAYKEGRVVGPVALFTTGRAGSSWRTYWTEQPELNALADMIKAEWKPGTPTPPPTPCTIPINRRRQILHPQTLSPAQEYQIAMWRRDGIPSALLGMTGPNVPVGVMGYSHEDLISAVLQAIQQQPESMLIVVDGDQIGTGLTPQWLQTYCPTVASTAKFLTTFRLKAWPVPSSTITQRFGLNTASYTQFGYPGHSGVDIAGSIGDPIKAMAGGVVDDMGYDADGFGHYVWIASPHGGVTYRIVYAHMDTASPLVIGQTVSAGQQVGVVGNTGNSSGSHLHVEMRIPGYTYKQRNGQSWPRNVHDISMWLAALKPALF